MAGNVDICCQDQTVSAQLTAISPFVYPFNTTSSLIVTRKEVSGQEKLYDAFKPFKWEVWVGLVILWVSSLFFQRVQEDGANPREFKTKYISSQKAFNNYQTGFISLCGGFVRQRPRTFCGMLLVCCMASNFMVYFTCQIGNMTSYITLSKQNVPCAEIFCILRDGLLVQIDPKSSNQILSIYPSLNDGQKTQDDLLKNVNADLTNLDSTEKSLQVGIKALLNKEVQAIILGYDQFIDLSLLNMNLPYLLKSDDIIVEDACSLINFNIKKPITRSLTGITVNPTQIKKIGAQLNSMEQNGTLNNQINEQLQILRKQVKKKQGKEQCLTENSDVQVGINYLSQIGAYLMTLPFMILALMVQYCQKCCCCDISIEQEIMEEENEEIDDHGVKSQSEQLNMNSAHYE